MRLCWEKFSVDAFASVAGAGADRCWRNEKEGLGRWEMGDGEGSERDVALHGDRVLRFLPYLYAR